MKALCPLLCILLLALLTAPAAADNPPATRPQPPQSFATPEEAAAHFLATPEMQPADSEKKYSPPKIIRIWRSALKTYETQKKATERYPVEWKGKLGDEKFVSYQWNLGTITGSSQMSANHDFALIMADDDGRYSVRFGGQGFIRIQDTTHSGWRDIVTGYHSGVWEGVRLRVYDIQKKDYTVCWSATLPSDFQPTLTPFPSAILLDIAHRHLNKNIAIIPKIEQSWCYKQDFDHDKNDEYVMWLGQVDVDGTTVHLGENKCPNWFLYKRSDQGYRLIYETLHTGAILDPVSRKDGTTLFGIHKQPMDRDNPAPAEFNVMYMDGKVSGEAKTSHRK